jgi:hypothetical protein
MCPTTLPKHDGEDRGPNESKREKGQYIWRQVLDGSRECPEDTLSVTEAAPIGEVRDSPQSGLSSATG